MTSDEIKAVEQLIRLIVEQNEATDYEGRERLYTEIEDTRKRLHEL